MMNLTLYILFRFIYGMTVKENLWWMSIKDKVIISKNRFCPPHYLPHKLPFGEKINHELCHYHKNKLRMLHHKTFCRILKCKNYEFMIKKYQRDRK